MSGAFNNKNNVGKPENHRNTFSEFHEPDTNTQMASSFFFNFSETKPVDTRKDLNK